MYASALSAAFLSALLVLSAGAAPTLERPACWRPSPNEFFFGVSGPDDNGNERFGRDNLAFLSRGAPAALFAAPLSTNAPRPSDDGFQDLLASSSALAGLGGRPEGALRFVITGHGVPAGVYLGTTMAGEKKWLEPEDFAVPIETARRAGKTVRGEFLSCFSGRFMSAMMPGEGLAPACALSSTVPEKKAEGCYAEDEAQTRLDYTWVAAAADDCRPGRDWRAVHAKVVENLEGYDIPMLSSDYFLLYGPAAVWLGRAARAPYPRGILVRRLDEGATVYMDLINARIVSVGGLGGMRPRPETSVVDCAAEYADANRALDATHRSHFFLHRDVAAAGWPAADCVPSVRLSWPAGGGAAPLIVRLAGAPTDDYWDPESKEPVQAEFRRDLSAVELTVPIDGLKPGARLLLTTILPAFDFNLKGRVLERRLKALAVQAQAQDPNRARAMREILRRMRAAKVGLEDGTRFQGAWLRSFLFDLFSENDTVSENLDYARLALLAAVTVTESELRREANTDFEAAGLVAGLEQLRACERGLR